MRAVTRTGMHTGLIEDTRGATLMEFAMVAPVFVVMLMGLFDMGFQVYAQSVLQGAVQQAGRNSTLEDGVASASAIDAEVTDSFGNLLSSAEVKFTRKNYANFEDIALAEVYTDTNNNDACDNGEPFEDVNGNGMWDTNRGSDGTGGARDAVVYTATATYARLFPLGPMIGLPGDITIEGATVLRNQPYDAQAVRTPVIENCT